jgi:N-acetylglutamate synthase-like GNAT family acetyltransferase|tara:strand:+ start:423 stop:839 length:417 start_codon:yes stop_codon:yes gene_type:complete
MKWIKCEWEDIAHLEKIAKSTKNTVKYSKNTVWWGLRTEHADENANKFVGCIGLLVLAGAKRGRIKSIYVHPSFRNKGFGNQGTELVEKYAFEVLEMHSIEAITRHITYWYNKGYVCTSKRSETKYVLQQSRERYNGN